MARKRIGTIVAPPGVFMDAHEKMTVDFLATKIGNNITFLVPERRKNAKTPDIEMSGLHWEIKSPTGRSSRTIENNLRTAIKQSPNIVIDLRRMDGRIPTNKLLKEVEHQFNLSESIKHIIVITRKEEHIDFKR